MKPKVNGYTILSEIDCEPLNQNELNLYCGSLCDIEKWNCRAKNQYHIVLYCNLSYTPTMQ